MLTAIALTPGILLLIYIYKLDKKEKEPIGLILKLLLFGIVCAFVASLLESAGISILDSMNIEDDDTYYFLLSFFCIAVAEEGAKYYFLRAKTWNSTNFDYTFDAIVYSVSVSLGFAMFENLLYVYEYGFEVGLLRAFTAVPGHFFNAILMGLFYGEAAGKCVGDSSRTSIKISLYSALFFPIVTHGAYDYLAMSTTFPETYFYIYLGSLYIICFGIVKIASKRDKKL